MCVSLCVFAYDVCVCVCVCPCLCLCLCLICVCNVCLTECIHMCGVNFVFLKFDFVILFFTLMTFTVDRA